MSDNDSFEPESTEAIYERIQTRKMRIRGKLAKKFGKGRYPSYLHDFGFDLLKMLEDYETLMLRALIPEKEAMNK